MKSLFPQSAAGFSLLLVLGLSASARADVLSRNSPFVGSTGGTVAAPIMENSPIELRGIMTTSTGVVFGLFDPVKRQGGWVRLNETGNDFTVRSYDSNNDAVTVEYQGRLLTLGLKTAKINTAAPAPIPPPMAAALPGPRPPMGMPQPPQAMPTPTPADEARRLETVAAEVRRRRALRQQASQQPGLPPPVPGVIQPTPQPTPGMAR